MRRAIFSVLPLATLAACGGSGATPVTFVEVLAASDTFGDSDVNVELTPSGETITVVKMGPLALGTDTAPDIGTFKTAFDSSGDYTIAFVSQSDSSVVGGAVYRDGATETHGVFYDRTAPTQLPTTGSATFEGDYVGMLISAASQGSVFALGFQGDAALDVDFGDGTVEGNITNRELITLSTGTVVVDTSVEDMILAPTSLTAEGSFLGDVSGGAYSVGVNTSTVSAASTYQGLVAGADADELVGGVSAIHTITGDQALEVGAFAAGH